MYETRNIYLSIVIVSWNAKSFLVKCLRSIERDPLYDRTQIVVVDNASSDGSPEEVEKHFPKVKLIRNSTNLGFAAANNVGIRNSAGRYVALINSDVEVLDGCLQKMVSYMDDHPSVGMLGPRILWSDRSLQSSCRRFPSLRNNFCPALGLTSMFPHIQFFAGEHMLCFTHDEIREVDALVGCVMLVRREAMDVAGLLDERFFIYAEDIDWSKRFWNAGWPVLFYPGAEAIHHGRSSSSNAPLRFALEQERAVLQYWQKHHPSSKVWAFRFAMLIHHLVRIIAALAVSVIMPGERAKASERMVRHLRCLQALMNFGS